tara:strand:+ start:23 stop:181 length:159 start_codon:yes stop_codon:yes gene_type:complete
MNSILYIGLGLLALGFLLFVVSKIMIAHYDRKLWQLNNKLKQDEKWRKDYRK